MTSFNAADVSWYEVLGTKGRLKVEPAYEYAEGLAYELTIRRPHDQARVRQSATSSQPSSSTSRRACSKGPSPEPSGEEGLQDVRIVTALYESAEIGRAVELPPYEPVRQPGVDQAIRRPPVEKPQTVNAQAPHS